MTRAAFVTGATRILVTGAAGFIGSRLARTLVRERKTQVVGMDSFTPAYPRWIKERNVETLRKKPNFKLHEVDLTDDDAPGLVKEGRFDFVYHQAALAGERDSWSAAFDAYLENNVRATQRLLEALVGSSLKKFVFASSSSVYGNMPGAKLTEDMHCEPHSPYGMTKLAGENLCRIYFRNFGIPAVLLRYFPVYGPGQRPDMAFHKFIKALFEGGQIVLHRGGQARDFTFIDDIVRANVLAQSAPAGAVFNIGTGVPNSLIDVVHLLEQLLQRTANIVWADNPPGNLIGSFADLHRSSAVLGYKSQARLREGLAKEIHYIKELYGVDT